MKTFKKFINENIRDFLQPKSEEEIISALKNYDKEYLPCAKYMLLRKIKETLPKDYMLKLIKDMIKECESSVTEYEKFLTFNITNWGAIMVVNKNDYTKSTSVSDSIKSEVLNVLKKVL